MYDEEKNIARVDGLREEPVALNHDIHAAPELGFKENELIPFRSKVETKML